MGAILERGRPLSEVRPDLLDEWDYEKNAQEGLFPETTSFACNKKCYWVCSVCGHKWATSPSHRTSGKKPTGCPKCGRIKIGETRAKQAAEKNNFAKNYPSLALEWHSTKNGELKAEDVAVYSNKRVWWECSYCHNEWKDSVNHRTSRGSGCPRCSTTGTSFPEQAVFYYMSLLFPDAQNRVQIDSLEFDVYINSKKIAIEYDGGFYHKDKNAQEIKKNLLCKEKGISLFRLREIGLPELEDCVCIFSDPRNLYPAIQTLLNYVDLEKSIMVDIDNDRHKIIENFRSVSLENSIAKKASYLLSEWHPLKNGNMSPDALSIGSDTKVWWKCSTCSYEWVASISHRVNGRKCPACSRKTVQTGINDLQTLDPQIAQTWDYVKNSPVLPSQVAVQSNKNYWWICEKGHSWQTTPSARRRNGVLVGCPYCANYFVLNGYNDLKTKYPEIAKEWHPSKNGEVTPDQVVFGSNSKYWWKCSICGGEWETTVASRVSGCGCRFCRGPHVLTGFNDLATTHPILAKQWHPDKNGNLKPENVRYGSNQKVWWKCTHCGWEWDAMIKVRSRGSLCPKCRKYP